MVDGKLGWRYALSSISIIKCEEVGRGGASERENVGKATGKIYRLASHTDAMMSFPFLPIRGLNWVSTTVELNDSQTNS